MKFLNTMSSFRSSAGSLFIIISLCFSNLLFSAQAYSSEKWPGVDETVIERYASEYGREAKAPLIDTDQGDMLLFLFLIAGAVGGFIAGYYWRVLTKEGPKKQDTASMIKEMKF